MSVNIFEAKETMEKKSFISGEYDEWSEGKCSINYQIEGKNKLIIKQLIKNSLR